MGELCTLGQRKESAPQGKENKMKKTILKISVLLVLAAVVNAQQPGEEKTHEHGADKPQRRPALRTMALAHTHDFPR